MNAFVDEDLVGRTVLGRYRIVVPLGRGGQGMVYLARGEGAAGFARPVVVKRVLTPFAADPQVLEQFAREARITSQLRHPDIVSVIDFERDGGSYVMVLEYVHGYDLRRWERFVHKKRGRLPAHIVAYVMIRVLEALHYAHTLRAPDGSPRQVIHRDISPANVLLDVGGHIKITDFGIARMDGAEEVTVVTSGMQIKGKLPYVAPELYRGAPPSPSTDLYACGVMLHELLTGKNEFRASNALETLALASEHVPTRVDKVRDDVSKRFAEVVAKSLRKDPAERFASAREFANALRDSLGADEAELEARFREVIREDFSNPELAQYVGVQPLDELDKAWRSAADVGASQRLDAPRSGTTRLGVDDPTVDEQRFATAPTMLGSPLGRARARAQRLAEKGRTPLLTWSVAGLSLAAVAFALVVRMGSSNQAPRVVYVDRESTASTSATLTPTAVTPEAVSPSEAQEPSPKELTASQPTSPAARAQVDRAARISAAFALKRPLVERCFAEHARDVAARTSVQVQFAVDRSGRVVSASLVPDELTSTSFGRCVVRAASTTRFGPQSSSLVFRIPVTARVVP